MTTAEFEAETIEERAEVARDLRIAAQQALGVENERKEWTMEDVSPKRKLYRLFSMTTGEEIWVPKFVFDNAVNRLIPGTRKFAFTARKDLAPKEVKGRLKCIFHPDAPEAEAMREIGIQLTCDANELRSNYSRRVHAENRHNTAWKMYSEEVDAREREEEREERREQTAAMLEMAGGTRRAKPVESAENPTRQIRTRKTANR